MINPEVRIVPAWRRLFGIPLAVTLSFGLLMVVTAILAGLPIRDPDGFVGPSYMRLPLIVLVMMLADILPRVIARRPGVKEVYRVGALVLRERWSGQRLAVSVAGLTTFYLAYVAYRNFKSFLPFLQDRLSDRMLAASDVWFGLGQYPAELLHESLGTGLSAYVLSAVYMFYMPFVPISLAVALVWSDKLSHGAWYVTALSFNWILGIVSYYTLPSLGPIYVYPAAFTNLPETTVTGLQAALWDNRLEVLVDPHATRSVHGIAAFASLHVSVVFTAALMAHLAGLPKFARWSMWVFVVLTALATVYFGWHYVVDVPVGLAIGALSVWFGSLAVRRSAPQQVDAPAPAVP